MARVKSIAQIRHRKIKAWERDKILLLAGYSFHYYFLALYPINKNSAFGHKLEYN